jgi:hypothetical protein
MHRLILVALLAWSIAALAPAPAARSVIIAFEDGTGNTSAPADDPGFANVGRIGGLTAVYIGDGWVLTAWHVGTADVLLEGVTYRAVIASSRRLKTDGVDPADLIMFQIESDPGLPFLPIAMDPPSGEVLMIGRGKNRGDPTNWNPPGPGSYNGWLWGLGATIRWGTNQVKDVSLESTAGGRSVVFTVDFTENGGTTYECQVATGDSGGAVFSKNGSLWELTGIHHARSTYSGQPGATALFGNESWSVQLSHYRDQILDRVAVPACDNGVDDDGDGWADFPDDPGCLDLDDAFERSADLPCDDGFDNDGDGLTDFPEEIGCRDPEWGLEDPACSDGVDNDGDGRIDWDGGGEGDPDPNCIDTPWKNREVPRSLCGLAFEPALALLALMGLRWRSRLRGS